MNKRTFFFTLMSVFSSVSIAKYMRVGYGSADSVLPAKNQELFYMGFELGIKEKVGSENFKKFIIKNSLSDGSKLGAVKSSSELLKNNVDILVGYPTSHEALLVSPVCKEKNIFCIFAGAGHDKLSTYGKNVVTTGESMMTSVDATLKFIKTKKIGSEGVVVVNPFAVFSQNQADFLKLQADKFGVKLKFVYLDREQSLNSDAISLIKKTNFIIVTPYADECVKFLELLKNEKIDKTIVTNSSWTTGDLEFIRRFIVQKKTPIYSSTVWLYGSKESLSFQKKVNDIYGREAVAELAYGFDLGSIVGDLFNRVKNDTANKSIIDLFYQNPCFVNTSSGTMCFNSNGGHALRKIYFVQFFKGKFIKVEGYDN